MTLWVLKWGEKEAGGEKKSVDVLPDSRGLSLHC